MIQSSPKAPLLAGSKGRAFGLLLLAIGAPATACGQASGKLIRDLQADLARLAYYRGVVDGVASDEVTTAILAFEHDEQVPPDAEPTPALLELTKAAIGRIPVTGACDPGRPVPDGSSVACGSIR